MAHCSFQCHQDHEWIFNREVGKIEEQSGVCAVERSAMIDVTEV